ncbi:DUF1810 domain-containing protein [Vibrio albus]|uniref:DUF1810 domain-containing protein n=1 Tax=Vibrio albus TaxID=2200953 RepID=A0A2U3B666_9VIBR|nr:DUF1810 domain-containing protein [Vibrio albus]PWI32262.1 DUF1810 domain-containing protein [Vibrio albus]
MEKYLDKFVKAQEETYSNALIEIKNGHKIGHWMWFIFPQIKGLGNSPTSIYYAIQNLDEARAYLDHPLLGQRLIQCTKTLLSLKTLTAEEIFGYPDVLKLCSSLTLFEQAAGESSLFSEAIDKFYNGQRDPLTLKILDNKKC